MKDNSQNRSRLVLLAKAEGNQVPRYHRAIEALVRRLVLARPLTVLDLESSGVSVERDRVVQIGMVRIDPDGRYREFNRLVNPGIPIPAEATAVHGITDADVASAPTFHQLAGELSQWLADTDLAGYNARRFDYRLLEAEFARAGLPSPVANAKIVDPFLIFMRREARTLAGAMRFFCRVEEFEGHQAIDDVRAALCVLAAQLAKYSDLPTTVDQLHDYCAPHDPSWVDSTGKIVWTAGGAAVAFGRNSGRTLKDLASNDPGFFRWVLGKDFEADTKAIVTDALRGKFPVDLRADVTVRSVANLGEPAMPSEAAIDDPPAGHCEKDHRSRLDDGDACLADVDDACLADVDDAPWPGPLSGDD
jgi:DNA polymerase-3 subunit epsilon